MVILENIHNFKDIYENLEILDIYVTDSLLGINIKIKVILFCSN